MQGLILAAGKGTRFSPYTDAVPKELLPVGDIPIIEHCVELLKRAGIEDVFIVVSKDKGDIQDYLKDGTRNGMNICYVYQNERDKGWGITKAIQAAERWMKDDFLVIYGDTFLDPKDFGRKMVEFHGENGSKATLALSEVDDPTRYGVVKLNGGKVIELMEKPSSEEAVRFKNHNSRYYVIAGMLALSQDFFRFAKKTKPGAKGEFQATDTIKLMLRGGLPIFGLVMKNLFYADVGVPKSYVEANYYYLRKMNGEKEPIIK